MEARDRATEARNSANELRDNARLGLEALTGQIRNLIDEAVEDALAQRAQVDVLYDERARRAVHGLAALLRFRRG